MKISIWKMIEKIFILLKKKVTAIFLPLNTRFIARNKILDVEKEKFLNLLLKKEM